MNCFSHMALSVGVAAAMLAGCGGSQPPIGAPGTIFAAKLRSLSRHELVIHRRANAS